MHYTQNEDHRNHSTNNFRNHTISIKPAETHTQLLAYTMPTTIDLDSLNDPDATQGEADIFQILKQGLRSEGDHASVAAHLAESLRGFIHDQGARSLKVANDLVWDLWVTLLRAITIVPIDHPWHNCLIATVDKLRREGGRIAPSDDVSDNVFPTVRAECLANLLIRVRSGQTCLGFACTLSTCGLRMNSFASRLLVDDFKHWIDFAWWEITVGLETAPQDPTEFEWRLWAVTEWLIQCDDLLFKDLSSTEELQEEVLASVRPGPLCADVHPVSLQRWQFWISRLMELSGGTYTVEGGSEVALSATSISRIEMAIAAMRRNSSSSVAEHQS
ncbi:unnamed protein product [Penicillium olsonii]|nr:unnamed protein product [Penicillium olsonii]CAG7930708.1 unnamed protein product [Penicillium olsonii]